MDKKRAKIKLRNARDVNDFVAYCTEYEEDIDVIYGRLIADGKSVLGVLAFGNNELEVKIHSDKEKIVTKFIDDISERWGLL